VLPGIHVIIEEFPEGVVSASHDRVDNMSSYDYPLHLQSERADHTLQSTALVNEAFLRLNGADPIRLQNRGHFIAIASRAMRQILVDYARSRGARKRDGGSRVAIEDLGELPGGDANVPIIALDQALDALSKADARQGKIVEVLRRLVHPGNCRRTRHFAGNCRA
jgi:RNA polymerase sigma factor (TIGR02999 family)